MEKWFVNGEDAGTIHPDDRGFAYGDGLFETLAFRDGRPRFLERHFLRLAAGCRRLGIPAADEQLVRTQIGILTRGHGSGTVKIVVTRGCGPRGYGLPPRIHPTLAVGFTPGPAPGQGEKRPAGCTAILCSVPASTNRHLAGLKTLNRLDNVLARVECQSRGADEGIMCAGDGQVIGGTMSNVFVVIGGALLTPALVDAGISGVMRGLVMEMATKQGPLVHERRLGAEDLLAAEEMFLTNSLAGLRPVCSFEGRPLSPGPVTRAVAGRLAGLGVEECCA